MTDLTTSRQPCRADESTPAATRHEIRARFASTTGEEGVLLIDTARHLICRIEDFRIVLFNDATLTLLAVEGAVALDDMPSLDLDELLFRCA